MNDNAPVLNAIMYTGTILAGSEVGSIISLSPPVTATDADEDGTDNEQVYFYITGSG